jgi:hypothetical protein
MPTSACRFAQEVDFCIGNPGPSWHAVGVGDFIGDAYANMLWQNSTVRWPICR